MARALTFDGCADRLAVAAQAARRGDPEGIHEVRVVCRQVRAGLKVGGRRGPSEALRTLGRALGEVRDLEVLLARAGVPAALRAWAVQRRRALRPRALAALSGPRFAALVEAIRRLPPPRHRHSRKRLQAFAHAARRAERRWVHAPEAVRRAHALRRGLRRWRYARLWLGQNADALAQGQAVFGRLTDAALVLRCAEAWKRAGGRGAGDVVRAQRRAVQRAVIRARRAYRGVDG